MRGNSENHARFAMLFAAGMLALACGRAGPGQRIGAPPSRNATLSLRSALVVPPADAPPAPLTLSCRGGPLCREMELPSSDARAEDVEEADEDCTHRGGVVGRDPCPRAHVVASCTLGGGAGPIRVFTYAADDPEEQDEAVAKMDDLCAAMDGTFELTQP